MKKTLQKSLLLLSITSPTYAALSWTGGDGGGGVGDGISLFAENNWQDDAGNIPGANTINGNTAVTADTGSVTGDNRIDITGGTGSPSNFGGTFNVGSGNSLRVDNKILKSDSRSNLTGGGSGTTLEVLNGATISVGALTNFENHSFSGSTVDLTSITTSGGTLNSTATTFTVDTATLSSSTTGHVTSLIITNQLSSSGTLGITFDNLTLNGATASITGGGGMVGNAINATTVNLVGSTFSATFLNNNLTMNLDSTSSLTLFGGGDPINSATNTTGIYMATGAQLTLNTFDEFAEQGNEIFINGVSYNSDNSLLSFNGTTATAVPEPSSIALISLAGLGLVLRRRR